MAERHVYRGTGRYFMACPRRQTFKRALMDLARNWNDSCIEGDVMMGADWYEPVSCVRMRRR